MSERQRTRGACTYCGRELTRVGMARHLATCPRRRLAIQAADAGPGGARSLLHIQVQDAWTGDYWLQLEVDGNSSLKELDRYLRAIWLECCGHLSQFSVGGWGGERFGYGRKASSVFRPGRVVTHIYDFGTESVTHLQLVASREGKPTGSHPITLMARNAAPVLSCQECGGPAEWLCLECAYDEERPGTLCEADAKTHPHDDYGAPMPLVNSPRAGMCGYEGPAEPPY